jgi:hypothetical protein
MFWESISSVPDETVIPLGLGPHCLVCGNRVYDENLRMIAGWERLLYYTSLPLTHWNTKKNHRP